MILLGLILIVIAVGAGVALFLAASPVKDAVMLNFWGVTQVKVLPIGLLIAGAVLVLLLWLGWTLLRATVRRRARRRREAKEAVAEREALAERERVAAQQLHERQQQERIQQERQQPADAGTPVGPAAEGATATGRDVQERQGHDVRHRFGGLFGGGGDKDVHGVPDRREELPDGRGGHPGDRGRL